MHAHPSFGMATQDFRDLFAWHSPYLNSRNYKNLLAAFKSRNEYLIPKCHYREYWKWTIKFIALYCIA